MDFNFSTSGMTLHERYELLNCVELIPIGTVCFRAGDFTEYTKKITVTKENQKEVTMFWNSLYFLDEKDADIVTSREHASYGDWLFRYLN